MESASAEIEEAAKQSKESLLSRKLEYNTFLEQYEDELEYLRIYAYSAESELIEREDAFELTNAYVTKHYYVDAEVVEHAKVGDVITIQGIDYTIQMMDPNATGYSVTLQMDENAELQEEQYVYPDIYAFERTKDGKHYVILFCSDDYVSEEIYAGSVFLIKNVF